MHKLMKEALVLLKHRNRAVVHPPLLKLPEAAIARFGAGLQAARIGHDGAAGLQQTQGMETEE